MTKQKLMMTAAVASLYVISPQAAFSQDDNVRDEIVVTGEKRGRSLQDTTTSTEIITTEDIAELNIVDIEDALRRIGNAGFTTVGSGANDQFILRGVQSGGVTPGGTPVATLIVDGAVIPNQAAGATVSNAWDVTQIEVLRGAQSTIQGRNSLIGAIVVNTQDPTYEWNLKGRATYAEENTWETSLAFGGPIIDDQLAFRISAQHVESDGFVERADGSRGDREFHTLARGKLLIEPAAIPGLKWDIFGTYSEEVDGSVLVDAADLNARIQLTDIATRTEREIITFGSELSYDINDKLSLVSVTSFANLMTNEVDDFDRLPDQGAPASPIRLNERDNTDWIQELRLLYDDGDRLEVLLGGLYARRFSDDLTRVEQTFGVPAIELTALARINPDLDLDAIYQDAVDTASGGTATIAGVPAGAPLLVSDPILLGDTAAIGSDFNFEPDFTTLAVFGEASYDLTDALEFTFGFRYEREEAKFTTFQLNALIEPTDIAAVSATGNPELAPAVEGALTTALTPSLGAGDAAAVAGGATPLIVPRYGEFVQTLVLLANGASDEAFLPFTSTNEQTFNVFMPKFVLSYDVTDNVSVALSAQRAYRPGGIGINPVRLSLFDFGPEFSWNYELAFRSVTADGRLVFNGNVFYIDWTDQQIEVQLTETAQDEETQNVGSSELYGIELQASFDATDDLQLFASIGVIETEITAVDDTNLALLNNEFPFAPNYSGSAGFTYRHPSGFNGTFDLTFQGESFVLLPNQQAAGTGLKNDSRLLANARIGYDFDNFSVYAFASNLFDDTYFVNADAAGGNVILGDPRVVGGGVSFEF